MNLGRILMVVGGLLFAAGLVVHFGDRLPLRLGRLPGDIVIRSRHGAFYFPLVTCLLLSLFFSLVIMLLRRR